MTQSDASCLALPADLLAAEEAMLQAALAAVGSGDGQRWAASLRFEGLRLLPVAVRLARALIAAGQDLLMVWARCRCCRPGPARCGGPQGGDP